jgi:hypothetical protein
VNIFRVGVKEVLPPMIGDVIQEGPLSAKKSNQLVVAPQKASRHREQLGNKHVRPQSKKQTNVRQWNEV